ncbi:site-2 protease family protein [Singulisphaera rosea]
MSMSWKLGRVAGIDVYVHKTFLLLLAYLLASYGEVQVLLLALSAFGCVLLHEYGHALMARRFGIETEDITLYPIGGVARLRRLPRSPGAELAIALAGPAVNGAIVMLIFLLGLSGVLDPLVTSPASRAFVVNLMVVNVFLGAFNLIPAFPMDGGRVLRAILSTWLGRARATGIAAGIGQALAILYGVYNFGLAVFDGQSGAWLQVFLATFIYIAAGAELSRVIAEERGRHGQSDDSNDTGSAPPGFRWVSRGKGVWQLAPITVDARVDRGGTRWP